MGLGVLEDGHLARVPGTVVWSEGDHTISLGSRLKYDRTHSYWRRNKPRATPIILVPQPSDDPNDPLNWPLWKRDVYLLTLSLLAVIASTLSSLLAANTLTISLYFGRSFNDVALLTGWHLLGVGLAGFVFVPSARIWGKRHLYLIGIVTLIFSSAWAGATKNCGDRRCYEKSTYVSLVWARVFQGIGLAPFEALVNASVGDLYFVHERGGRMALTNLALFGGAFCTPIIVGKMTHELGWEWPFYFVAIFCGLLLPVVIFFLPETAFRRDDSLNTDIGGIDDTTALNMKHESGGDSAEEGLAERTKPGNSEEQSYRATAERSSQTVPAKESYWSSLKPFNGRKTEEGYLRLLLRPFPLFLHPGILWACLIQGVMIGWTVMIGVVLAAIMLAKFFFDEVETGYLYTGAFLGAIVGFFIAGVLADISAKQMTKMNKGIYEPEFRMVLVIVQLILGCVGLFGFGWTSEVAPRLGYILPCFFFGCQVAGMVVGAVASALYIVDAHRDIAVEAFTCLLVFKNIFSFGLTTHAYLWLVDSGIWKIFRIIGGIQIAVCALTIPMYVFGKRNRSYFARHPVFYGISDFVADSLSSPFSRLFKGLSSWKRGGT